MFAPSTLPETLKSLMHQVVKFKHINVWMELVPWYHALCTMNINTHGDDYDQDQWWGLDSAMKSQVQSVKENSQR